ncbi:hypothetical protein GPECTOR_34g798 [Gonium pectorale]|uniref:Peptidase S59 domain-containing protein n=1 Tax=Gonium pectorale TaxID=33097 RepID=A0A150GCT1_GONPE|nr:hypothetical protein GPECTOR_34g798 [Gonium pectorale]|eukprot:KXZ47639.1 hypothetical protein GPECTOR_34g798 [Gonium pectorale]
MFGFGGTSTGFGQPAQQPAPAFGAQAASPFGNAFGQPAAPAASPFGAGTTGTAPLFGAQAAAKPAGFGGFGTTTTAPNPFGAATQTPGAFGTTQAAPAFGAGLGSAPSFGATLTQPPAFGAASASAFGAPQSTPAFGGFGASSAPAFGAPAAAPANPFGSTTTGFGAAPAAPAFGAAPAATGFGAPATTASAPFGSTTGGLFGTPAAAPSPFGAAPASTGFGTFGAAAPTGAPTTGTRNVPYSKTKDPDVPAGQPATFLMSVSALPNFQTPAQPKSHEELRWEDYEQGVKNQSAGPAPAATGTFGAPAPAAGGFGGFGAASSPATGAFGAPAAPSPFGAPATSAPAFGAPTTAPAFGAASQPSLFGTSTTPANPFGAPAASAPAFGGFGAAPAATSQPSLFGGSTAPAFGATGAFGTGASPFGGASSAAAFSFNSSPATFGAASQPATSLFGTASTAAPSPFGSATGALGAVGSPFGAASSASAFGTSTFGAFGATAAKPAAPPFGAPAAASPFGASAPAAGTSLFGNTPFNFNTQAPSTPSIFGSTPAPAGTSMFGSSLFGTAPASTPATGTGLFGAATAAAAPSQPPTVAQPAYGNFGSLPAVPDAKVGITTRATRVGSISTGTSKASPLLSLRPTPVRYGASVRARSDQPANTGFGVAGGLQPSLGAFGGGTASDLLTPALPSGSAAAAAAAAAGGSGLLPLRQNPHRLFIAAPPPSTEAAGGGSFLSPARPASARGGTPDGLAGGLHGDDGLGHADGAAAETPAAAGRMGGLNGYTNGYATAAGTGVAPASGGFRDAPAAEAHLPRLDRLLAEGYSFSPNVDELRLLHSQSPANLAAVSNFTVSRAGVGQVRWVVPVDVRGLALQDIVQISYGEVLCYPNPATKPAQGSGLNKPAEITLYGVYRKDKETGAPIKEGARGQGYEKLLRQMCGRMGAKFVSYKLDGGVWKFEVEHFSRYGLMDLDEDDDGAAAAGTPMTTAAAAAAGPARASGVAAAPRGGQHASPMRVGRGLAGAGLRGFAFGAGVGAPAASAAGRAGAVAPLLLEDSEFEPSVGQRAGQMAALPEAGGSEVTGGDGGDRAGLALELSEARAQLRFGDDPTAEAEVSGGVVGPEAGGGAGGSTITGSMALIPRDGGAATSEPQLAAVPLQHALPASLAQDPMRMRALQEAFFGGGGMGGGNAGAGQLYRAHPQTLTLGGSVLSGARLGGADLAGGTALGGRAAAMGGKPATTAWRRPAAALSAGAPAAVMGRGASLLSEGDDAGADAGGSGAGGMAPSPISLALARAVTVRPSAGVHDASTAAVLPLHDVRTAGCLTDAGLAMGRSFRVGWGPGGRLVVPGAGEASSATEICVTRVRVEGEGAAYGDAAYGSPGGGASGPEDAEGLESMRERLRSGLEVHLAASRPTAQQGSAGDDQDAFEADGADATTAVPYWRLCVDARELAVLVDRYVRMCEGQLQQLLGGGGGGGEGGGGADADHPEVLRLRHEIETWRLLEVLFARIDGEVPERDTSADADPMVLATPPSTPPVRVAATAAAPVQSDFDMASGAAATGDGRGTDGGAALVPVPLVTRTRLAALQRRAQLGSWLQRQARRRVEEDLATAGSTAAVVLQLLAGHQLAAAAGAAVAAGDPRLAVLIARAGSRSSARAQLDEQLKVWRQSGFDEAIQPERLAAYGLLAGQVLETQRLLSLDWRRLLGLHLWYGTPSTVSPMAAVRQYLVDRHVEPATVPHPAPYHVEGLQPSATGAGGAGGAAAVTSGATDVQWELLQLWSTTAASAAADCLADDQMVTPVGVAAAAERTRATWLAGGGCSRLLRVAGYSSNPLDHSLAWQLMTALQAAGVLPTPGTQSAAGLDARADPCNASLYGEALSPYDDDMLGTTMEFITQLLMAGGLCEWALYVALSIPDLPVAAVGGGGASSGAVRQRVVRELLSLTAHEWIGDSARQSFMTGTLRIPQPLLAEARATWAQYAHDDDARCAALLAAGDAAAAHEVFMAAVAPRLFLAGSWSELAALIAELELAAAALPTWPIGGGLYGSFLALFGRQLTAAPASEGAGLGELVEFAQQVQEALLRLDPRHAGAGGDAANSTWASDEASESSRLRRRVVLGRMAARVQGALMTAAPAAAATLPGGAAGFQARAMGLQAGLALQGCLASELQMGGLAIAVAEAGMRVSCSI